MQEEVDQRSGFSTIYIYEQTQLHHSTKATNNGFFNDINRMLSPSPNGCYNGWSSLGAKASQAAKEGTLQRQGVQGLLRKERILLSHVVSPHVCGWLFHLSSRLYSSSAAATQAEEGDQVQGQEIAVLQEEHVLSIYL